MAPSPHHLRILIVDDNAEDVYLIRQAIEAANPNSAVTYISDGEEAFQLLTDSSGVNYDLIVLDWRLPRRSAQEIVAAHIESKRVERPPVVILTSGIPPQAHREFAQQGVSVLLKPLDLNGYTDLARQLSSLVLSGINRSAG